MIAASFIVRLTLRGPVLTQSTIGGRFGVNAVMARLGEHYYLPGTLLKGLVGEAWQELASVDPRFAAARRRWLGRGSDDGGNEPARGTLFFEDLLDYATPTDGTRTQTRIKIDDERGSVKRGQYLIVETPYRAGEQVRFEGKVWVLAETPEQAEGARRGVQTALRWLMSAGAGRSIGFGRVVDGECTPLAIRQWSSVPAAFSTAAFDLELRFERPVCFARRRVANNLFESEPWIAGAALKGALDTLLQLDGTRWPNLAAELHAIRFTHAFPALSGAARPTYPPASLVQVDGSPYYDAIYLQDARLDGEIAPAFQVDWKDGVDVWRMFGWSDLQWELRVRTAIDGGKRRAADDELFAYRMIVPDGVTWRARVLLAALDEEKRARVAAELEEALQHGLFALGKTKAHAAVTLRPGRLPDAALSGDHVAITLQTAALLCDPGRHLAPEGAIGSTDRAVMWREYEHAWRDLSDGSLELENYFHRQSLAGGEYFRHRFQRGHTYRPYLLTDAGSVFLFRIRDAARAPQCITRWLQQGIELAPAVKRFYSLDSFPPDRLWQHCPFIPENGYGEIAVNVHETNRKDVEVWHVQE